MASPGSPMDWEPTRVATPTTLKRKRDEMPGAWPMAVSPPRQTTIDDAPPRVGCFSSFINFFKRFKRADVAVPVNLSSQTPSQPTPRPVTPSPSSFRIPALSRSAFTRKLQQVKQRGPGKSILKKPHEAPHPQAKQVAFRENSTALISPRPEKWFQIMVSNTQDAEIDFWRGHGASKSASTQDVMCFQAALAPVPMAEPDALDNLTATLCCAMIDGSKPKPPDTTNVEFDAPLCQLPNCRANRSLKEIPSPKYERQIIVPRLRPSTVHSTNKPPLKRSTTDSRQFTPLKASYSQADLSAGSKPTELRSPSSGSWYSETHTTETLPDLPLNASDRAAEHRRVPTQEWKDLTRNISEAQRRLFSDAEDRRAAQGKPVDTSKSLSHQLADFRKRLALDSEEIEQEKATSTIDIRHRKADESAADEAKSQAEPLDEAQLRDISSKLRPLRAQYTRNNFSLEPVVPLLPENWTRRVDEILAEKDNTKMFGPLSISRRDLSTVVQPHGHTESVGPSGWLNDAVVVDYLKLVVAYGNLCQPSGKDVPRYAALSSFFWKSLQADGFSRVQRWVKRAKIDGRRILECKCVFIPICQGNHWTLLAIKGNERRLEYYDSLRGSGAKHYDLAKQWLQSQLGDDFIEGEWTSPEQHISPMQNNGKDCGVFAVTSAKALVLDHKPLLAYSSHDIPTQRMRIVAEMVNGAIIE